MDSSFTQLLKVPKDSGRIPGQRWLNMHRVEPKWSFYNSFHHWLHILVSGHSKVSDFRYNTDISLSVVFIMMHYTVLIWQKEASDIPSKSELFMFLYFTKCALLAGQILYAWTLILLRDMLGKTSWYSIDVSGTDRHTLLFYKKCQFCHLLPFTKVGQYSAPGLADVPAIIFPPTYVVTLHFNP